MQGSDGDNKGAENYHEKMSVKGLRFGIQAELITCQNIYDRREE